MSSRDCIRSFSSNLFWDTDLSALSLDDSPGYVIQRVLEHGQMSDWQLINKYYGLDKIVEECKQLRTLDPVCLAFITTHFTYGRKRLQMLSFQTVLPDTLELLRLLMRQPLLSMSYFADADPQPMPYMFQPVGWNTIKDEIQHHVELYNCKKTEYSHNDVNL